MCQMIDEFSDVNEGEKEFMKMWNVHVQVNYDNSNICTILRRHALITSALFGPGPFPFFSILRCNFDLGYKFRNDKGRYYFG